MHYGGIAKATELGSLIILVVIAGLLELLIQAEAQSVLALMADGQIRKDEVTCRRWSIQAYHSGDGGTGEDCGTPIWLRDASMGQSSGLFQSGEEEVVGIHGECDIAVGIIEDLELHDWRRVDWSPVGGSYIYSLDFRNGSRLGMGGSHLAPAPQALAR
jgi:hypothetical protein